MQETKSKLRRWPARNKSPNCTDLKVGDAAPFHKAPNRESAARRRGPAMIPGFDDTGLPVKFQNQTFEVARNCAQRVGDANDVGEVD